jgi:hypothetical protein
LETGEVALEVADALVMIAEPVGTLGPDVDATLVLFRAVKRVPLAGATEELATGVAVMDDVEGRLRLLEEAEVLGKAEGFNTAPGI